MTSAELVVADHSLEAWFDERTFWRGLDYAERGRVLEAEWCSRPPALVGEVMGSGSATYFATVRFVRRGGVLEIVGCECTCPVGVDCKHAAAVVLTVCKPASHAGLDARAQWETSLGALLPEPADAEAVSLGLQVAVSTPQPMFRHRKAAAETIAVTIRPVHRGRMGWMAGKLTWANLAHQQAPEGRRFDHEQVTILREIYALYQSGWQFGYYGADKTLDLAGFESPRLWPLLRTAQQAGIALVWGKHGSVPDPGIGRYCVDLVDEDGGELSVTPSIRVAGEPDPVIPLVFIGSRGHGVVYTTAADRPDIAAQPQGIRLARLDPSAPKGAQRLLIERSRLTVPSTDRQVFAAGYYPQLSRAAEVSSSDESFIAPVISGPSLLLDIVAADDTLIARWWWLYRIGDVEQRVPVDSFPHGGYRDPSAEYSMLREVGSVCAAGGFGAWSPGVLHGGVAEPTGLDALRFVTELLPSLRDRSDIRIDVDGDAPDYREVGDSLVIALSADETGSDTDWFDLGITITVDGRPVPFQDVFTALCSDESHMILPGGAYFALDKPELRTLRRLIDEARALHDDAPGALRISRYQAALWQELTELGVVSRQADEWRQQMRGLLNLTAIETPPPPPGLTAVLRPYQLDGFAWLAFLWQHRLGGILADDMGLGKTVQALALICHALHRDPDSDPWLIIAPASVVSNWVAEAARFAPGLRVVAVADTLRRAGRTLDEIVANADVIVTSYTLLRLDAEAYTGRSWAGLLLDEAQFVKNHQSRTYQAARRVDAACKLAVTGTPLENNVMELWALLSITAPGLFPHPARFREYYAVPIEKGGDTERLAQLRRRIAPLLRRRTKEQVAADLPPKQQQVLQVELTHKHRKIYDTRLQRERQKVLGLIDDVNRNRLTILRSLTVLRQLSLHAGLVDDTHDAVESAKIEVLVEHLHDAVAAGHRSLVFSQFTGFLAHVRRRLDAEGIGYCYLDGRTRKRADVIQRFRDGVAPVFLISLKAGGFGLNLTEADYCFLLDPWWNPAAESQAVDRTHRIGQTRTVLVYRLIAADTIEQKVMELKERKAQLFDGVLDDEGGGFGGSLEADDIRALFE